jgi:hypothetical protein
MIAAELIGHLDISDPQTFERVFFRRELPREKGTTATAEILQKVREGLRPFVLFCENEVTHLDLEKNCAARFGRPLEGLADGIMEIDKALRSAPGALEFQTGAMGLDPGFTICIGR